MIKNVKEIISKSQYNNLFIQVGGDHINTPQELHKNYKGRPLPISPFVENFDSLAFTKFGCIYREKLKYYNDWFLNEKERTKLFLEYKGDFTMFDVSKNKKDFDTSFDYIIYCR